VTPLAEPVQAPTGESLLTKTSLALHHEVIRFRKNLFFWGDFYFFAGFLQEAPRIGSAHNTKAAPFTSLVKVFMLFIY
jgi:hypothetical protein